MADADTRTKAINVAEWVDVSVRGLGGATRSTVRDERVMYVVGRTDDNVVVSGVAFSSQDITGIYEVSTPPEFRRRGHARALVEHIVRSCSDRVLGVWPNPLFVPLYTDVGFVVGGQIAAWFRG